MTHTITVTTPVIQLPSGGQAGGEVVLDQRACEFVPLSAEERLAGGTLFATATHVAVLWWEPGVRPEMLATVPDIHDGGRERVFTLSEVTNVDEGGRDLKLVMTERVT